MPEQSKGTIFLVRANTKNSTDKKKRSTEKKKEKNDHIKRTYISQESWQKNSIHEIIGKLWE